MAEDLSGADERGRGVLTFLSRWSRLLDGVDPHAIAGGPHAVAARLPKGACVL